MIGFIDLSHNVNIQRLYLWGPSNTLDNNYDNDKDDDDNNEDDEKEEEEEEENGNDKDDDDDNEDDDDEEEEEEEDDMPVGFQALLLAFESCSIQEIFIKIWEGDEGDDLNFFNIPRRAPPITLSTEHADAVEAYANKIREIHLPQMRRLRAVAVNHTGFHSLARIHEVRLRHAI